MYQGKDLSVYPFFAEVLEETPISTVLDSLTGVVSRAYMLDFLRSLIRENAVFTIGMIDLDNFKSYNDNYGHTVGDHVLSTVAASLMDYVGSRGVVGRFGGDEFLVISFIGNDYHDVHDFYESMFNQGNVHNKASVFRRDIYVDHLKLFLSATLGSASFPKDARDFDTLFALVDKTLYRGKFKGRNCYIIYLPEKHANLEIPQFSRHSQYDTFMEMANAFDRGSDLLDRLQRVFEPMRKHLRFHFMFHISPEGSVLDIAKNERIGTCEDLSSLITDGYYACGNHIESVGHSQLSALMKPYGIYSMLLLSIGPVEKKNGYILLSPEPNTLHIWQDEEFAAGFVLIRLVQELYM